MNLTILEQKASSSHKFNRRQAYEYNKPTSWIDQKTQE